MTILNEPENEVIDASHYETVFEAQEQRDLTFGERLSDIVASFGGSWHFIICSVIVIFAWIIFNQSISRRPFDPYPFVFLNLILSCVAALQAPIIMMSQRRQDDKDRERAAMHLEITRLSAKETESELRNLRRLVAIMVNQLEKTGQITPNDLNSK